MQSATARPHVTNFIGELHHASLLSCAKMLHRRYVTTLPIIEQRLDLAATAAIRLSRATWIRLHNRKFIL
jgi:hypothetical protein